MKINTTIKVTLTDVEKEMMIGTSWGAFTRANNAKIGRTLVRLLEKGTEFPKDPYDIMDMMERESGVGEVTDTECRDAVCWFLDEIKRGRFPNLRPDLDRYDD